MVSVAGLLLSVATSFSVFLFLVLVFLWLSKYKQNHVIYYPARLVKGLQPLDEGSIHGIPKWLWEALFTSGEQIAEFAGMDAAVYIRFLRTGLEISCAAAVYGLFVLVPICATDHFYEDYNAKQTDPKDKISYDTFDLLGMGNVSRTSSKIWAFVLGAWWMSVWTLYFLYCSSEAITLQLANYNGSPRARPEQLTVLVQDIPRHPQGKTRQEQVDEYFRQLYPASYMKSVVILQLSRVVTVWNELKKSEMRRRRAEAVQETSGVRPTHRLGLTGLRRKVDSLDFYDKQIKELEPLLEREQLRTLQTSATAAAFVFFKSRAAATKAAQVIHSRRGDTWIVSPAPDPRAVRWGDVATPLYERGVRRTFMWAVVLVVVIFFLIPVSVVSALANVRSLERTFSFLTPILELPYLKQALDAFLPQLVLYGSLAMVPYTILYLANLEAYPSEGRVWQSTAGKVYLVLVFNIFIGLTITGTLFSSLQQIVQEPTHVFELLGSSVPSNATFFISYVALIFYVSYGLELSRLIPLVVHKMRQRYSLTEEDRRAAWAPGPMPYHLLIPQDVLILTLGLCYAVIAPMILPFTAIYFCFALLTYRHQVLNVYVSQWEGGGKMWPHILTRTLTALIIAQLTLIGYFGLNGSLTTLCLLPLPVVTYIYGWISSKRFRASFEHPPLEDVRAPVKEGPSLTQLVLAYTPECMHGQHLYEALGEPEAVRTEARIEQLAAEEVSASTPLLDQV